MKYKINDDTINDVTFSTHINNFAKFYLKNGESFKFYEDKPIKLKNGQLKVDFFEYDKIIKLDKNLIINPNSQILIKLFSE